ncbi:hypothetical protein GA0115240_100423 [Streptomyces sp. DvalAA-14]|nr:hypothetical protein GA0115240_100423 [Streptomyces sp. DvalAA-14]
MKKINIRPTAPVRLTSAAASFYNAGCGGISVSISIGK